MNEENTSEESVSPEKVTESVNSEKTTENAISEKVTESEDPKEKTKNKDSEKPSKDVDLNQPTFKDFNLDEKILKTITDIGYEIPTPIQQECIPLLLEGRDVLGQAQTGTGKTAAFALPLISQIDINVAAPQVLVLAPTRELAIQVAEAFQTYSKNFPKFRVLPVYGGQSYDIQLKHLKRGVHVVVGTPGRVMDHLRRKTLKLDQLKALVLDEADEMLNMGFYEDVQWILEHVPENRQTALFSATMPARIQNLSKKFLNNPIIIKIKAQNKTAQTIRQRVCVVGPKQKLDALTRILEMETPEATLVFVRTKTETTELAQKLSARGYNCAALSGDLAQRSREILVNNFKKGVHDIVVATDVAARGIDVERITHVINFDIPHDTESYIHRIGRTGRAGRTGDAIMLVTQRERRLLKAIEKMNGKPLELLKIPTVDDINGSRITKFKQSIIDTIKNDDLTTYRKLITDFKEENEADIETIAAALVKIGEGNSSLLMDASADDFRSEKEKTFSITNSAEPLNDFPEIKMARYYCSLGRKHRVKPANFVGAIANEIDIDSDYIGSIDIHDNFSTIDLPGDMPKEILEQLNSITVANQEMEVMLLKSIPEEIKNNLSFETVFSDDEGGGRDRGRRSGGRDRDRGGRSGGRDRGGRSSGHSFGGRNRDGRSRGGRDGGSRGERSFGGDRGGRDGGNRSERSFGGDRGGRDGGNRGERSFGGDRGGRDGGNRGGRDGGDRGGRSFGGDRGGRDGGNRGGRDSGNRGGGKREAL